MTPGIPTIGRQQVKQSTSSARERHGVFRRGAFSERPYSPPIDPIFGSGIAMISPAPNTCRFNIQLLSQFRPHRGFLLSQSTLPSSVARLLHARISCLSAWTACKSDGWRAALNPGSKGAQKGQYVCAPLLVASSLSAREPLVQLHCPQKSCRHLGTKSSLSYSRHKARDRMVGPGEVRRSIGMRRLPAISLDPMKFLHAFAAGL